MSEKVTGAAGLARPDSDRNPEADQPDRNGRGSTIALAVFLGYLVLAGFYLLLGPPAQGRWFFGDDWFFLLSDGGIGDVLAGYQGHWVGIPALIYQGLFSVFGLTTYLPYLTVVLAAHLVVVLLLRVVMRRSGAGPWTATAVASVLVLYPAAPSFMSATQMTLIGALAFGLGQLLVADHDGPFGSRDLVAQLLGLAALMTSGIGLVLAVVVFGSVLLRRGWRPALYQVSPPLAIYLTWTVTLGGRDDTPLPGLRDLPAWVADQWAAVTTGILGPMLLSVTLLVTILAGLWFSWSGLTRADLLRRSRLVVPLAGGAVLLTALTWWTRGFHAQTAAADRYVYILSALVLPLIAVGINGLIQRNRAAVVILVPLVLLAPLRINQLNQAPLVAAYQTTVRALLPAVGNSDLARQVPGSIRPDAAAFVARNPVTVEWLIAAAADGRLPPPPADADSPAVRADLALRLGLDQDSPPAEPGENCRPASADSPLRVSPRSGDLIVFRGENLSAWTGPPVRASLLDDQDEPVATRILSPASGGDTLVVTLPDLDLLLAPTSASGSVLICQG